MSVVATSYGAWAGSPLSAAATLRSLAHRYGSDLGYVTDIERVAAVVAAEVWMHLTGAQSFNDVGVHGTRAVKALSVILLRASGKGVGSGVRTHSAEGPDLELIAVLSLWVEWAQSQLGENYRQALALAATDLAYGDGPEFLAASTALFDF